MTAERSGVEVAASFRGDQMPSPPEPRAVRDPTVNQVFKQKPIAIDHSPLTVIYRNHVHHTRR
jgi:hypothetical protein